jgi:acyl carrier protein
MLKRELIEYIQDNLVAADDGERIGEDTPLIEKGIVDSMGLMQIMGFVEERTGVRIPDDHVRPANFATVSSINDLVERLRQR